MSIKFEIFINITIHFIVLFRSARSFIVPGCIVPGLTLVLLNPDLSFFENTLVSDKLASDSAI